MLYTKFKIYESNFDELDDYFDIDDEDDFSSSLPDSNIKTHNILTPEQWKKKNPKYNNVYYHGSNKKFTKFDNIDNKTYKEFDLPTWFFTKDLDYCKVYGNIIYTVNLKTKNTFDTDNPKHFKLLLDYLKDSGLTKTQINDALEEKMHNGLPYWTFDDAYYAALENGFDSILLQEELETEVISIGVFNKDNIEIIDIT